MPYDLYWHGPINAYSIYCKKANDEAERKRNEMFDKAWLYGKYFSLAILDIYKTLNPWTGKDAPDYPYPEKPYRPPRDLSTEEKKKRNRIIEKMKKINEELGADTHG